MSDFVCLGDPHLGRVFRTGVPLHRIGDREAMVWAQFERALLTCEAPRHINLGDLFDKFVVPPEVVIRSATIYRQAATSRPGTTFVILQGNHDASKDTTKSSSFDLFRMLLADLPNVLVVHEAPHVIGGYGFVPYAPLQSASEQMEMLPDGLERVFTHHDFQDWSGDHVLPTELLARKGILNVTNGHEHLARVEKRHGVTVTMHGSLQPYSHAEDPDGILYRTVTLADLAGFDATNLNIRILLQEGDVLPVGLNCLSLTAKRVEVGATEVVDTTEFDGIDLSSELSALLPDSIRDEVMEIFKQ